MRLFFTILSLIFSLLLSSQNTLLESSSQTQKKTYRYSKFPNDEEKIINHFLEKISPENQLNIVFFEIAYHAKTELKHFQNQNFLTFSVSQISISGQTSYRNVNIAKQLLPSSVSFQLSLYDNQKNEVFNLVKDTCCLINPADVHEWKMHLSSADTLRINKAGNLELKFSKTTFLHSDKDEFDNYILLIDEYYNSEKILSEITQVLNSIKTDNIEMMPLYQIDLNRIQKQFEKIENQKFYTQLDLSTTDPINFKGQYRYLKERYATIATVVNHLMSSIDEVYFNKGYSFFLKNNYDKAIEYFELSIRQNPLYVRSHYRLAEIHFIRGQIEKSAEIIQHVLNKLSIEKDIEANILALAQQIMLEFIDRGNQKIRAEDFHQSLKEFEKADTFCKSVSQIICHPAIKLGFENSHLGLYKSYLTIAAKAVENNKMELAAKFIYDAKSYLNKIGNLNINPKETDDIIELVIDNLIEQGRNYYHNKVYEDAIRFYNKAMELCSLSISKSCTFRIENELSLAKTGLHENIIIIIREHIENENIEQAEYLLEEAKKFQKENKVNFNAIYETENLVMLLDKLKYRNHITKGNEYLSQNLFNEALGEYLNAKSIEKECIAFPDINLNNNIRFVGKNLLIKTLSEAKIKVWGNDLKTARELEREINSKIKTYLLENDSLIVTLHNELLERIEEQECNNLNFEVDKKLISVERQIKNADYITAYHTLTSSLNQINSLSWCRKDTLKLLQSIKEIENLYHYQHFQGLISESFYNLKFEVADSLILIANKLYRDHPEIKSIFKEFAIDNTLNSVYDCTTLFLMADYYTSNNNIIYAISALVRAKDNKCKELEFSSVQNAAGSLTASIDFKKDKKTKAILQFKLYKTENEWFKDFQKAYKKRLFKHKYFLLK